MKIKIDGKEIEAQEGMTILQVCEQEGIEVPTLCYHQLLEPVSACRMCVVETGGKLVTSCSYKLSSWNEGHEFETESPKVVHARKTILEMLFATVDLEGAPEILDMAEKYNVNRQRFPKHKRTSTEPVIDNPFYIRDYSKCIMCRRCVLACADDIQFAYAIDFSGRGSKAMISTAYDQPLTESTCVFCGNCVGLCPTDALVGLTEWQERYQADVELTGLVAKVRPRTEEAVHEGGVSR